MAASVVRRVWLPLLLILVQTVDASADDRNWAEKMFNKLSHDFGVVARGADVSYRFRLKNPYKETVHISGVRTSCGCSAARPSKTTLPTYDVAFIEVTMDTRRFMRQKDSNLIVTFDRPLRAEVQIPLKAYIRSDVVLEPGSVNFGSVDVGSQSTRTIEIAYAGRDDWNIRSVDNKSEHLKCKLVERERSAGRVNYDLQVALQPTAPVGTYRHHVFLVTDDVKSPYVPILVQARVESDITVTPEVASFGTLSPGGSESVNIILRGRKPFRIEKVECESATDAFKFRIRKEERLVHVLPITFTAPEKPGKFTETFTVTVAGRDEPVTFRAYGRVTGTETASAGL